MRPAKARDLPNIVSLEVITQLLGIAVRRAQQLATDGVIARYSSKEYKLAESIRGYVEWLRARNDAGKGKYSNAKARLTAAKAEQAEIELAEMTREMIPAKEIEDAWGRVVDAVRTRLLAVPNKVARRVVVCKNVHDAQEIIKKEIYSALEELSRIELAGDRNQKSAPPVDDEEDADQVSSASDDDS